MNQADPVRIEFDRFFSELLTKTKCDFHREVLANCKEYVFSSWRKELKKIDMIIIKRDFDNPFLPTGYIDKLVIQQNREDEFRRQIFGRWIEPEKLETEKQCQTK